MAGFCECQGVLHGFSVADFSNQNNVGCLAQRVFQCIVETQSVHTNFSLIHYAFFMFMHIFHRIFNGNDVSTARLVAMVNQCSK